jgi:two-component system response regulator YesN
MERAKALLADPYVSVAEVANRIGYEDPNYFVRVFRKTVGVSPNRWRGKSRAG